MSPCLLRLFLITLASSCLCQISLALDFRLMSWEGDIDGWYYRNADGETLPLTIRDDRPSNQWYSHAGERPVELFIPTQTPNGTERRIVLSMPAPQGMTQAILLIRATPDGRATGLWIDDSPAEIPIGSMRVYNFFPNPSMLKIDGKTVTLQQTQSYLCSVADVSRAISVKAAVLNAQGAWKLFSTLPLPVQSGKRMIVFIREARTEDSRQVAPAEFLVVYDRPRRSSDG